jgi:hypothetical protein
LIYQFLCLYKILEATRIRRNRLAREATAAGLPVHRPLELVPDTKAQWVPWLRRLFPPEIQFDDDHLEHIFRREVRGRKFEGIIETHLRPLRVDIAHALFEADGEITESADKTLHSARVEKWLPLVRCLVRQRLINESPEVAARGRR